MPARLDVYQMFAARTKQIRTARGWSYRDLSGATGMNLSVVYRAENGGTVTLANAGRIADGLGVPLGAMLIPASCGLCCDAPPPGFTCNACGAESEAS